MTPTPFQPTTIVPAHTNATTTPRAVDDSTSVWTRLEPGLSRVKALVADLDAALLQRRTDAIEQTRARLECAFAELERELDTDSCAQVGRRVRAELLPIMLLSENAERWYSKPRGYAGDYLSIARIYDDEPRGHGRVGAAVDRCFLNLAAVKAVQNRRALLAKAILDTLAEVGPRPARVTSLASGPARELFDVYASLEDPTSLAATLVDIDLHALAHVADQRDAVGLRGSMNLIQANLVHVATGRSQLPLEEQDFVYSIGLIDYFSDAVVLRLLDYVHSVLRPGGRVMLGNFHPRNPTRALMDHVLDWKLVHRDESDLDRLFQASAFGRTCTRILYEPERINLFAECVKATGTRGRTAT